MKLFKRLNLKSKVRNPKLYKTMIRGRQLQLELNSKEEHQQVWEVKAVCLVIITKLLLKGSIQLLEDQSFHLMNQPLK